MRAPRGPTLPTVRRYGTIRNKPPTREEHHRHDADPEDRRRSAQGRRDPSYAYDAIAGAEARPARKRLEAAFRDLFDGMGGDAAVPLDHPARKADEAAWDFATDCFDVGVRVGVELEHLRRAVLSESYDGE